MPLAGRKRPHSDLSVVSIQPREQQTQQRPRKTKRDVTNSTEILEHPAATFRMPNNPRATLLGLPAELRLQIYSYLSDTAIIHVHHHDFSRFTWTPCRLPSSASPLLCANPKWSGMCEEEDRCTYNIYAPPEPIGFWALAASNRMLLNETQEFFLRKSVVSIHPHDLRPWLDHLADKDPKRIENLRQVTLAGPNSYRYFSGAELQLLRDRVPNLEAMGFQCQDMIWPWARRFTSGVQINPEAWTQWAVLAWMQSFDSSITIAIEAMIWKKSNPRWSPDVVEQQVAIRIIRKGKTGAAGSGSSTGWSDEDIDVEIVQPGKLASPKRNAKWRQWWRGKEMRGFA